MPRTGAPPRSVRPEWLFEVAGLVQRLTLAENPSTEHVLGCLPAAESRCERAIVRALVRRVCLEGGRRRLADRAPIRPVIRRRPGDVARLRPGARRATIEAARILRAEYARKWRLDGLARRVGSNRTDLEAGFQALFGCSVHEYLTVRRVREARRLLHDGALTIEDVGRAGGYRSRPAFCLIFRRFTGMTPREYRRRWTFVLLLPPCSRTERSWGPPRGCRASEKAASGWRPTWMHGCPYSLRLAIAPRPRSGSRICDRNARKGSPLCVPRTLKGVSHHWSAS